LNWIKRFKDRRPQATQRRRDTLLVLAGIAPFGKALRIACVRKAQLPAMTTVGQISQAQGVQDLFGSPGAALSRGQLHAN